MGVAVEVVIRGGYSLNMVLKWDNRICCWMMGGRCERKMGV